MDAGPNHWFVVSAQTQNEHTLLGSMRPCTELGSRRQGRSVLVKYSMRNLHAEGWRAYASASQHSFYTIQVLEASAPALTTSLGGVGGRWEDACGATRPRIMAQWGTWAHSASRRSIACRRQRIPCIKEGNVTFDDLVVLQVATDGMCLCIFAASSVAGAAAWLVPPIEERNGTVAGLDGVSVCVTQVCEQRRSCAHCLNQ